MKKDLVLIIWIISDLIWSSFILGGTAYIVFWKDFSGLWFLLAIFLCSSPTLFNVLKKRYDIKDES